MDKVAGVILLVEDIQKSADFYKQLGFAVTEERPDIATIVRLDKFWVELLLKTKVVSREYKEDVNNPQKGAGIYLQVQVGDTDAFYETVLKNGVNPPNKPKDFPWGQREFIVIDPDGYKIAFFNQI